MDSFLLRKVDLHVHSTASDGLLTPSELVSLAGEKGISVLSITDHDTVSGVREALVAGKSLGITVVPGIEVTADTSFLGGGRREFHVLGYYFDVSSPAISDLTEFFHNSRVKRNEELVGKLESLGFDISYDFMVKRFGANFGKPNIAKVLIDKGYFSDRESAIDYLSSLGVKREKMDYREIVRLIREAGGISVIAHPVSLNLSRSEFYCFIKSAKEEGIEGLEVYHYRHKPKDTVLFKELCSELSLFYTGGSDFHGDNKPCIDLGFMNIRLRDINFPIYCTV